MTELVSEGIRVSKEVPPLYREILSDDALQFIAKLARAFTPMRDKLLLNRKERQKRLDQGELPDFLPETKHIREGDWTDCPVAGGFEGSAGGDYRAGRRPETGD